MSIRAFFGTQLLSVMFLLLLAGAGVCRGADDQGTVITYLKNQEHSITSYTVTVNIREGHINANEYNAFSAKIPSISRSNKDDGDLTARVLDLLGAEAAGKLRADYTSSCWGRGKLFKSVISYANTDAVQQYDGERHIQLITASTQKQIDVYAEPQSDFKYDLEALGICMKGLTDKPLVSQAATDSGYTLVLETNKAYDATATVTVSREMEVESVLYQGAGEDYTQQWFLGNHDVNGYSVPRLIVSTRKTGNEYDVSVLSIQRIDINGAVSDDDLRYDIPPTSLIVDHRVMPPRAFRILDYVSRPAGETAIDIGEIVTHPPLPTSSTAPALAFEETSPPESGVTKNPVERPAVSTTRLLLALLLLSAGALFIVAYVRKRRTQK